MCQVQLGQAGRVPQTLVDSAELVVIEEQSHQRHLYHRAPYGATEPDPGQVKTGGGHHVS